MNVQDLQLIRLKSLRVLKITLKGFTKPTNQFATCQGFLLLCIASSDHVTIEGYVRGSSNGKICKSTNGTVGTIFTNGNQKTLNAFLLPMVPLVPTVPLVGHMVEFLTY